MEENMAMENMEAAKDWDFETLLKDKEFQSEFDRRVSRALETARSKWAREMEQKVQQARLDGEERARMSGEERMALDLAEREARLEEREREIAVRELKAETMRILQERGLPMELADVIDHSDAEAAENSLNAVETAFRNAVRSGVEERMRGNVPMVNRRRTEEALDDADYYRMHYATEKEN